MVALAAGCTAKSPSTSTTGLDSSATTQVSSSTTTLPATTTAPPTTVTQPSTSSSASTTTTKTPTTTAPASVSVHTAKGNVTVSARQFAGQRVIYSYKGLTPPDSLFSLIRQGEAAGVIFFRDNISSLAQIKAVIARLEQANESASNPVRAPLLFMTDQEGGPTRRLPGAPVLSEKGIGLADDPVAEATKAGTGAAVNLHGVGMNVNLAPVLDVYRQAGGFLDKSRRSYSTDPQVVGQLASAFITAQQEGGVAATAKHFPGLGSASTSQNTDAGPVILKTTASSLRSVDEPPYKAAIKVDVRLVMLSWAIYPALDGNMPAGLSSKIVQGELRDRLGFKGVTITDSLSADALQSFGSPRHRALLAAEAGIDLLLCSGQEVTQGDQALSALYDSYLDGTLATGAFQAAVERIIDLRFRMGQVG
jgi:beta-N-acetylhexosaminidase